MEFTGVLYQIGDIESLKVGDVVYEKRAVFVKYLDSFNKEQLVKFYLLPPRLEILEGFQVGEKIIIQFDFNGFINKKKNNNYFGQTIIISVKHCDQSKKTRINTIPHTGYIGPDFSRTYEEFPSELVY